MNYPLSFNYHPNDELLQRKRYLCQQRLQGTPLQDIRRTTYLKSAHQAGRNDALYGGIQTVDANLSLPPALL